MLIMCQQAYFKFFRSEDLANFYYDAGQGYWYDIKKYLKIKNKNKIKIVSVELKRHEFQDINTMEDFRLAEKLFK